MPAQPPFSNYEHEIYAAAMLGGRRPARSLAEVARAKAPSQARRWASARKSMRSH